MIVGWLRCARDILEKPAVVHFSKALCPAFVDHVRKPNKVKINVVGFLITLLQKCVLPSDSQGPLKGRIIKMESNTHKWIAMDVWGAKKPLQTMTQANHIRWSCKVKKVPCCHGCSAYRVLSAQLLHTIQTPVKPRFMRKVQFSLHIGKIA